ncbi:MAG: SdpI family protein [Planctomycetota bacterium]
MKTLHLVTLAIMVVGDVLLGFYANGILPRKVPVHWNLQGEADRIGTAWELAFTLPIVAACLAGLLILLSAIPSVAASISKFQTIYGRLTIAVVAALIAIHATVLLNAAGHPVPVDKVMMTISGTIIVVLGNWMGKVRRNGVMGIRTPWTLANDIVWERTHRVGGGLMVIYGIGILIATWTSPPLIAITLLIAGALSLSIWSFVYSRRIYRSLPHAVDAAS